MKYSTIALFSSLASLISASPVLVTETDFLYQTVTVDADGKTVGADAPVVTVKQPKNVNNLVYVTSVIYGNAPAAPPASVETSSAGGNVVTVVAGQPSSSAPPAVVTTQVVSSAQESGVTDEPTSTSATPPAATTTSAGSGSLTDDDQALLNVHNTDRAAHQAPSMTWNDTLASYAQEYLNNQNCVFAHSGGPYGENIALGFSTVTDAANAWYDEYKLYDYSTGQFGEDTGHFTQMVWKASVQLGCATVDCSGSTFLACEYYPRGNIIGQFTENVLE